MPLKDKLFKYDVAISFAGEDRNYAKKLAEKLKYKGIKIFYDEYEKAQLWGKDLYRHLSNIYSSEARYCVIFVSQAYAKKLWTNHELRSAQERALREIDQEYILPVRLDDTELSGLPNTIGYIDLRKSSIEEVADLILQKIGFINIKTDYPKFYELLDMAVVAGISKKPTATIRMRVGDIEIEKSLSGDGPVDAVYKTIYEITQSKSDLMFFKVKDVRGGDDALGEVYVTLRQNNNFFDGHGADTDITVSAAKALIDALNKIAYYLETEKIK